MTPEGSREAGKLNKLLQAWPGATVVTQKRLDEMGIYRQLPAKYVRHNWIERLGAGAYVRSGVTIGWQGALYALQTQLGKTVHVGGRTALELLGLAHSVPLGRRKRVVLISDRAEQLPAWFRNHTWGDTIEHHCLSLFDRIPERATARLDCGGFAVLASSAERAMMEVLRLARTNGDVEHAIDLMEDLTTLRPDVVEQLLESCTSVKVKRLFLWSAEAAGHDWVLRLDATRVDLGKGKRQVVKGGSFDPKYRITVPRREGLPGV